jgi:ferredoxin
MRRKVIRIDEEKCNGCGECATACAEGAIEIVDGKAKLVSETYCDGLGNCLAECPEGAITIEEREAVPFDEQAVAKHLTDLESKSKLPCGCPGTMARQLERHSVPQTYPTGQPMPSELAHWPVQLTLLPPTAPFLQGADLLLVADCVPFALPDFHSRFLRGRAVAVGCPKLDNPEFYVEKLTEILKRSSVRSLTVIHMEVPCCSGLTRIASAALAACEKEVPAQDVTVSIQGEVIEESEISPEGLCSCGHTR